MHDKQTIVTDVRGVCLSVCHAAQLGFTVWGSFCAAFAKSLWLLVIIIVLLLFIRTHGTHTDKMTKLC